MKTFDEYLQTHQVQKRTPDTSLARATWKSGVERLVFAKSLKKPKYAVENIFEAIREFIDAELYAKGYKSYSHEACVAYLATKRCPPSLIRAVDRLRERRNALKYYGRTATMEEVEKAMIIAEEAIVFLEEPEKDE